MRLKQNERTKKPDIQKMLGIHHQQKPQKYPKGIGIERWQVDT